MALVSTKIITPGSITLYSLYQQSQTWSLISVIRYEYLFNSLDRQGAEFCEG